MNKETLDILNDLSKRETTDLALSIMELTADNLCKDKEIERLNNIIDKLEKWLNDNENPLIYYDYESKYEYIYVDELLDKLKELKEGK